MTNPPYPTDEFMWACCTSSIGPLCQHLSESRIEFPETEIDVSTETPVKFNNRLEVLP